MTEARLRIAVIDNHRLFAAALAARLGDESDLEVPVIAESVTEAMAVINRDHPAVILLDYRLGQQSGFTVLPTVREQHPDIKAIMLSAHTDVDEVVSALRRGFRAWVPKSADVDQLLRVIRAVARGYFWLPEELLGPVLDRLMHGAERDTDVVAGLTSRERVVLAAMNDGLTRAEIARKLHLSPNTVRTHTQNILAKLNCHSVLEAVALARRSGMQPSRRTPES